MDIAELIVLRDALRAIRGGGVREVESGGRRVAYRSDAEIANALANVERQIRDAQGMPPVSVVRVSGSKGV